MIEIKKMDEECLETFLQPLSELEREIFGINNYCISQLLEMIISTEYICFLAVEKKNILGYLIIHNIVDNYEIMKIGVLSAARKKRIGSQLLKKYVDTIKFPLLLEVRETNEIGQNFYNKNGFEKIGIRKNYYKDTGENAIIMKLDCK
jgi:ribosomal-protein-alanine N-acetyltransferase